MSSGKRSEDITSTQMNKIQKIPNRENKKFKPSFLDLDWLSIQLEQIMKAGFPIKHGLGIFASTESYQA